MAPHGVPSRSFMRNRLDFNGYFNGRDPLRGSRKGQTAGSMIMLCQCSQPAGRCKGVPGTSLGGVKGSLSGPFLGTLFMRVLLGPANPFTSPDAGSHLKTDSSAAPEPRQKGSQKGP